MRPSLHAETSRADSSNAYIVGAVAPQLLPSLRPHHTILCPSPVHAKLWAGWRRLLSWIHTHWTAAGERFEATGRTKRWDKEDRNTDCRRDLRIGCGVGRIGLQRDHWTARCICATKRLTGDYRIAAGPAAADYPIP